MCYRHSVNTDDGDDLQSSESLHPRRKISSEFSPLAVTQHIDSWSSNLLDLFGDGSRKGSVNNLQPLGKYVAHSKELLTNLLQRLHILAELLTPRAQTRLNLGLGLKKLC